MPKTPRYLITTHDERTWEFDRPVIFLGEWCRLFERKNIWENMDAIVAEPYGLGLVNKDADNAEARMLEENLFLILCNILNQQNNLQHEERFWRITLGHWLRCYVNIIVNRVKTLEKFMQMYQISGTKTYLNNSYILATKNSISMTWASNDPHWNNVLIMRILDLLGTKFPVDYIKVDDSLSFQISFLDPLKKRILKWVYRQLQKLLSFISKDSDAFIISSYLPKKVEIKLQIALRQFPQFWISPTFEISEKYDLKLRRKLSNQIRNKSKNYLENILSEMLFELLPICYLEGFPNITDLAKKQSWPKYPKFIFTSNNFDTDELFKVWLATKVESGSKYFAGQHGSNYGTHRYINRTIEEVTAERFITWGWKDELCQHTPAFIFKTAEAKNANYNSQGFLLLVELCIDHRVTIWDDYAEFNNYFKEQNDFVSLLSSAVKKQLIIRLPASHKNFKWNEEARWKAFDSSLKIDNGSSNLVNLISQSRLVVYSYDSTGMLENLSKNIPTVVFWQNNFDHLRDQAKPFYQALVDAEILHLTPVSLTKKINKIWNDIDYWWNENKVQEARKYFCEKYARQSKNPVCELKKILIGGAS